MTNGMLSKLSGERKVGAAILGGLITFSVLEGVFNPTDYATQDLGNVFAPPTWSEPFGTDQYGRSMLARMGSAIRLSLFLSLTCVLTAASIGVILGVIAGWRKGGTDRIISFFVNMVLALPGLVLILLVISLAPGSLLMIYIGISLVLWVEYFRVVRAVTNTAVMSSAMQASRTLGFGWLYCFRRHVWPAIVTPVLTLAAFGAAASILTLAAIGFVMVGLKPPTAELGFMMVELFPYYSDAPWALVLPMLAVFLLVLSLNLLAGTNR